MNKEEEKLKILTLISKGYVLPLEIYPPESIKEIIGSTFIHEEKEMPIIKSYTLNLDSILVAKINPNFKLEDYENID